MKTKLAWEVAHAKALEFKILLSDVCERLEFAGSLRRHKKEVGDIEIVLVPRVLQQPSFFDVEGESKDLLEERLQKLRQFKIVERGIRWGPRHKELSFMNCPFDLYIVRPPAQWGVILAIRTGPAEFSMNLVKSRRYGGFLPEGFRFKNGALWQGERVIDTPEEEDVFRAIGLAWLEPRERH